MPFLLIKPQNPKTPKPHKDQRMISDYEDLNYFLTTRLLAAQNLVAISVTRDKIMFF